MQYVQYEDGIPTMKRIAQSFTFVKLALACLLIVSTSLLHAAEEPHSSRLEAAQEMYLSGDYESAFAVYEEIATTGAPEAHYYLGLLYAKKGDFTKSIELYRLAAEKEYVPAIRQLGYSYFSGEGVETDPLTALDWLRQAAAVERKHPSKDKPVFLIEQQGKMEETSTPQVIAAWEQRAKAGEAEAQYRLAKIYDEGFLTEHSIPKAVKWYTADAENDHQESQFILGYLYCRGTEVEQNIELADAWLKKSNKGIACKH